MSRLKDLVKNEDPVHERRMEFRSYPLDKKGLIVEGWLRDERFVPGYIWDGTPRQTGMVHWMCVRMLVGQAPLTILEVEAEMPGVPHELCTTTMQAVKKIVGLSISAGYSEKVHELLGGIRGCTHLTHLIVSMGPAALHGYATQQARKHRPMPSSLDELPGLDYIINSCALWKEDGPLMQSVLDTLKRHEKDA